MSAWLRALGITAVALGLATALAWASGRHSLAWAGWPLPLVLALLSFALNAAAFVPAAWWRTERFYDAVGSLSFIALMAGALAGAASARGLPLGQLEAPRLLLAGMVMVWTLRLGGFLILRIRRAGHDVRFAAIKLNPARFLVTWMLQALWACVTALPALVLITSAQPFSPFGWSMALGLALWCIGLAIEAVADAQKTAFRADPANARRFIHTGLWAWSRHPNYCGEILLWAGVAVCGAGHYQGGQWLALLSPLFVYALLTRISGIPPLEAAARKRWGTDPAWQAYQQRTPLLWPRPPRGASTVP